MKQIENRSEPENENDDQVQAVNEMRNKPEVPPQTLAQIISNQFYALQGYQRAALANDVDDVEAIHKLRVTTRKLQASLDLLQIGTSAKMVGKSKNKLRNLRRKLSEVRNYDVFLGILQQESTRRKSMKSPFEVLTGKLARRRAARASTIRQAIAAVDVARFAESLGLQINQMEDQLDKPSERGRNSNPSLSHIADDKAIWKHTADRLEQRLEEFLILASLALPTTHPEELHQLRIAAKRLRYLLESASDMGFDGTASVLKWLRRLQDRIGDWHDLEAIESEIIAIVSKKKFVQHNLFEASSILAVAVHLQKKKLALVGRLFPFKVHKNLKSTSYRVAKALRLASQ